MKEEVEQNIEGTDALSFDNMLSISKIFSKGKKFGEHCCLVEVDTDTDRDIFKYPVRINAYILVICSKGLIELNYNLYRLTLSDRCMFLYNPKTILRIEALKPSKLSILAFSNEFVSRLGIRIDNVPLQYRIVKERLLFSLDEKNCVELCTLFKTTMDLIEKRSSSPFYDEMNRSSIKTFIFRVLYEMNQQYFLSSSHDSLPVHENNHFDRFMRLLQDNYIQHRSIRFYSDRMGLSPKYLSLTIKKISGKLATEWIDEYVILEAKNLIKYSSMNVQEISYALNFPNQSFFGKYFKRHTGLSPKAYRQKL